MSVQTGLEVFLAERLELVQKQKVGLLAHPASVDSNYSLSVDLLHRHPEVGLTTIFGPQHGARGETQDNMIEWEDYRDPASNLPVYSLYGKTREPTQKMLEDVDVLVFDLQDVGARYYTYIYSMVLAMRCCEQLDKEFVVLDRPNPINGVDLEGPVLDPKFSSFVGLYPLAIRHGMTTAELARYFKMEFGIGCRLHTVPMKGWRREFFFDDTRLPWVLPSPNIPTLDTSLVYPGVCLLEGTNVSEGRGTTRPFEISGAPWVQPQKLADELNQQELPGVFFRPLHFIPTFHKWGGQMVGGVQIHVTDRRTFRPFLTGLALTLAYRNAGAKDFQWKQPPYEYEYEKLPFDILCGTDKIRLLIEGGSPLKEIEASWQTELQAFAETRQNYLLY